MKGGISAAEWKAIAQYAQARELKPQLSDMSSRLMYFKDRHGKEIKTPLSHIISAVEADKARNKQA